jgi:AcrR family transcriptional regulator
MPKAFTPQERQIIAQRLLEAGTSRFSTFGLRKTSVEELTQAAGISKSAFYLFFESKEALFMDVVEEAERRFRREVLGELDRAQGAPRERLAAVLRQAFRLWRDIPVLRFFTRSEYERIARRMPPEKIHEHLSSDLAFISELVERSRRAGIPIQAPAEDIAGLMYIMFFSVLHQDDLGAGRLSPAVDLMVELVAAYCLGEVDIQAANPPGAMVRKQKD